MHSIHIPALSHSIWQLVPEAHSQSCAHKIAHDSWNTTPAKDVLQSMADAKGGYTPTSETMKQLGTLPVWVDEPNP